MTDKIVSGWNPLDIWPRIKKLTAGDSPFVYSQLDPQGDFFEVELDVMSKPVQGAGQLRIRLRQTAVANTPVKVQLLTAQGVEVAGWFVQPPPPPQSFETLYLPLSVSEVAQLDYVDTRLRVTARPSVQVPCCPKKLSQLLTVTVTNPMGDCTCLPSSFYLSYMGERDWGARLLQSNCPGPNPTFQLRCNKDDPAACTDFIFFNFDTGIPAAPTSCQCDPLSIVFDMTFTGSFCTGSARFEITE